MIFKKYIGLKTTKHEPSMVDIYFSNQTYKI